MPLKHNPSKPLNLNVHSSSTYQNYAYPMPTKWQRVCFLFVGACDNFQALHPQP